MKILLASLILLAELAYASPSDTEITKAIIKESIASYKGICPCPYSTHPDGRQCGYRSAFSTKSASAPICYSIAVTPQMIEDYKKRNKL